MTVLWYLCGIAAGYLLGCINTAAILAGRKGFDIRARGSGNAGASNALVTMGKGAAVITALTDIMKAFLPVFLLKHVIPLPEGCEALPIAVGAAVMLGHMFPFWMQFRGGKGYASLLGTVLAADWRFFLICIAILALLLFTVRYIALATVTCAVLFPVWLLCVMHEPVSAAIAAVLAVIIVCKHIQNIRRIANGTEIKFRDKAKKQEDAQ